ncbi:acyl-CoA thioesterase [Pseudonocardia sediminis]|uniref:Acyl-CoA thioesterase n=1 Tax=Pseudonocardia sediminis TaxID=1397368 RepID=A0A4Q7V1Y5_PSEST|nr:thioesterase family protein [Pseudonocardia sediminis]RZT88552.1 acyl-CoA thioesterase [Pseudonocardia sediminis]
MSAPSVRTGRPFSDAHVLADLGGGRYRAELDDVWAVGPKAHGGLLLVLLARAALSRLAAETGTELDPLAVSADFLRAPDLGPVELVTEPLKIGRTVSSCAVRLVQGDRLMLHGTVTAGVLPTDAPRWAEESTRPAEPTPDAVDPNPPDRPAKGLSSACELRYPPEANAFARGETGPPVMSGWVRPHGEDPDVLFALLAGDILPPTVFNLGGSPGWAPTVQLTALLRGHPAPGWLRVDSRSEAVVGTWFDEDLSVVDSSGRLVCQARQIALAPLPRD